MRGIAAPTFVALLCGIVVAASPCRARAATGDCGQPISDGAAPVASDCLYILNVAVGAASCSPPCICAPSGTLPTAAVDALACLIAATGGNVVLNCPCDTTTTTLPIGAACPDTLEITAFARTGVPCGDDEDCPVGSCDLALGRCVTATDFDFGWTGIGHDLDTNDGQRVLTRLSCGDTAPCGTCQLDGPDPTGGACRCANDNRSICDEPFAADQDDCGGGVCNCYFGPPVPLSSGGLPACIVNRLTESVSGSIDVDSGDIDVTLALRAIYYTGEEMIRPCPYCAGDTVATDGARDGTCVLGANAGLPCDADALSSSFPAPGGGGYSLDCFPDAGKNSSGTGLLEHLTLTTGPTSLTAAVDCTSFGVTATCHCGICSENGAVACRSDADCAAVSAGICEKRGNLDPRENGCLDAAACTATGDGDAICKDGPIDRYCDGVVRADGQGLFACTANVDCEVGNIGIDGGNCALSKTRECFLPTIDAQGIADPEYPITAGIFCVPPTSTAGRNALWGLPGPARLVSQMHTGELCGGPAGAAYIPGNGCPPAAALGNARATY